MKNETVTVRPSNFRHIRLQLAREPNHPDGDNRSGYDLRAPLTGDGHLDAATWKADPKACRVRRFRPEEEDGIGHLARKPGGQWFFDYGPDDADDETGFRFGDERFVPGEYVSIRDADGHLHTFRTISVVRL